MRDEHPDIAAALDDLEAIIHAPLEEYGTMGERAGAYAALYQLHDYLEKRLEERKALSGYASEKLLKTVIHGAGMLGFGERREMESDQERVAAMGNLNTLRSVVAEGLSGRPFGT